MLTSRGVHLPVCVVLERRSVRRRGHAQREPHVVGRARALRIPRVTHEHVRRLQAARDREYKRRLRVVSVRRLGGNVSATRPYAITSVHVPISICATCGMSRWSHTGPSKVRSPEDLVGVRAIAGLRGDYQEVDAW